MALLSRKADYALLILSHLDGTPGGGTARAIAERYGLSRPFAANILKELCHKGFVTSHRGVNGGYDLARPAETITLAELLEVIDERFELSACSGDETCSLAEVCTVKEPIRAVHRRILDVLQHTTLADVFRPNMNSTPITHLPLLQMVPASCPATPSLV